MNRKKFERYLSDSGCFFHHRGGRHDIWWDADKALAAPVPRHKEITTSTVKAICKQLNITPPREK